MYMLDGSLSYGNADKNAVGAIDINRDWDVLVSASHFKNNGYLESPEMHIIRGKMTDMGPDSMTIRNDDGTIRIFGIDFTENIRYADIETANKSIRTVGIRGDVS